MISVIIPAYNEEAYIGRLLEDLAAQETDEPLEVIVADANSTDRTRRVAESFRGRFANFAIVEGGHPAVGRNKGARQAQGHTFFFMDADVTLPDKEFLKKAVAYLRRKKLGIAAVYNNPDNDKITDRLLTGIYNVGLHAARFVRPLGAGACMVVDREVFHAVGGFQEDLVMNEDHDFAYACSRVGKYGILPWGVTTSMRRLDKEGRLNLVRKYAQAGLYRTFKGPIRRPIFEYDYEHGPALDRISFVIPAYNEEKHIGACLESIRKAMAGRAEEYEIIVVDNASTDRTAEAAAAFPGVKVVHEPRQGTGWARQRGLQETQGSVLAYLDADCRISADWLDKGLQAFRGKPGLAAVSGPYRYYDLHPAKKAYAELLWWLLPAAHFVTGRLLIGGNFLARREALDGQGFNTELAFYGDDTDTACRLRRFGPIRFDMDMAVLSSGRRLAKEGVHRAYLVYVLNYFWILASKKAFPRKPQHIR